jgi:hypothetical protein
MNAQHEANEMVETNTADVRSLVGPGCGQVQSRTKESRGPAQGLTLDLRRLADKVTIYLLWLLWGTVRACPLRIS